MTTARERPDNPLAAFRYTVVAVTALSQLRARAAEIASWHQPPRTYRGGRNLQRPTCTECGFPHPCRTRQALDALLAPGQLSDRSEATTPQTP